MTDNRNTAVIVLSGLSPEEKAKVMREARSFCDKHEIELVASLPAPTQDGTAEEFMDQWSNHNSWRSKGGIHKMITAYAAPLRAEIERLKSELAASCSPNLVLPKSDTSNPVSEYWRGVKQGYNDCLTLVISLNPSLFK